MANPNYTLFGVTGGIGSGKSEFSKVAREMGHPVIDADHIAREVVEPDQPGWKAVYQAFGPTVFQKNQQLDRSALRQIIAKEPRQQKRLNRLLHPIIRKSILHKANGLGQTHPFVFVEAALMIEAGSYTQYEKVILITSPEGQRIKRVMSRDQKTQKETQAIINLQMTDEKKAKFADLIVVNDSDLTSFRKKCREAIMELTHSHHENQTPQ